MSRRNKYDWPTLFQEFAESGLNQAQFCEGKGINPNYFSLQHTKHKRSSQDDFTRVEIETIKPQEQGSLVFKAPQGEIHFDSTIDPVYIASLIRAL